MPLRVIEWSTGNVGRFALRCIIQHPDLELVGVWVHDPKKAGHDAGALCGLPPTTGVKATNDVDALLALDADCVCYTATADLRPLAAAAEERLTDAVAALPLVTAGHPYNAEALIHGLSPDPAPHPQDAPWVARHGLTGDEYQTLYDDLTADGYRLHQVDSYLDGGSVRYAAIFEIRPGHPVAAFHGLDDGAYAALVDDLKEAGYVPVNESTVEVGGSLYWTGLFEQVSVTGWTVQSVPAADYQDTFDDNYAAGRLLTYVHGFNTSAGPYITGIWVDPIGGGYAAVHGRTGEEYQTGWDANTGAGLFTRYTSGYDDGGGTANYAALWRGRPSTSIGDTPNDPTNQTSASFEFASGNPFATFECRLDGGSYSSCTSPKNYSGLSEGYHTFEVRALDRDRVLDLSAASFAWLVDVTPPEITITEPTVNTKTVNGVLKADPVVITTVVGWATFAAHVTDNLSGVATVVFKVDGVPVPVAGVSHVGDVWSFEFEPQSKNAHNYTIEVIATDNATNVATESMIISGVKTLKKH